MNQWSFSTRSSLIHLEDPYSQPYEAVVHMKGNYLAHYGVKGQKWGVMTKEYEPVAVDHRRLRTAQKPVYSTSTRPQVGYNATTKQQREQRRREREGYYTTENGRTVWRQNGKTYSPSEQRQRIVKRALIGAGIAAGLLAVYGAIRVSHIRKAKAYSGILNRFISQNPTATQNTDAGRKLLKRGMQLAKKNSAKAKDIQATNSYLNKNGLNLSNREALKMYRGRKDLEKQLNYAFDRKKVRAYLRSHWRVFV